MQDAEADTPRERKMMSETIADAYYVCPAFGNMAVVRSFSVFT
jgi:hypothetical protein